MRGHVYGISIKRLKILQARLCVERFFFMNRWTEISEAESADEVLFSFPFFVTIKPESEFRRVPAG